VKDIEQLRIMNTLLKREVLLLRQRIAELGGQNLTLEEMEQEEKQKRIEAKRKEEMEQEEKQKTTEEEKQRRIEAKRKEEMEQARLAVLERQEVSKSGTYLKSFLPDGVISTESGVLEQSKKTVDSLQASLVTQRRKLQSITEQLKKKEEYLYFQIKWEDVFVKLWDELTDAERESITPIPLPYTEESVISFVEQLKSAKKNRDTFNSIVSLFPDSTANKLLFLCDREAEKQKIETLKMAIETEQKIVKKLESSLAFHKTVLQELENKTHPFFLSCMKTIPSRKLAVGTYLVTQSLWEAVMHSNPSHFKGRTRPVDSVSWLDCVHFCNKLSKKEGLKGVYRIKGEKVECNFKANGYRLPTVEEWTFVAKAHQKFDYAGSNDVYEVAWYDKNSDNKTHPVGQKKPNGFGLYDISGNVWEWCWDKRGVFRQWFTEKECTSRIIRGGSFLNGKGDAQLYAPENTDQTLRRKNHGLRLFRTLS